MPRGSTPWFVPIPSVISSVVPLIIGSSFENSTLLPVFWWGAGHTTWDGATRVLSGSPSLIINVWLPNPILSKRVWFEGGTVRFPTASGDGSRTGPVGFFQASSVPIVSFSPLLRRERGVLLECSREEAKGVAHGHPLGCKVRENVVECLDGLKLDRSWVAAASGMLSITGACAFRLILSSEDGCVMAHLQKPLCFEFL